MTEALQKTWTPSTVGEVCAQELQLGTQDPERALNEYRLGVQDYYAESGYAAHNPEKAHAKALRWTLHVASAPLFFGVETELANHINDIQASDATIPAEYLAVDPDWATSVRARIRTVRKFNDYTPQQWAFLETTSHMAYQAAIRYLKQTHTGPQGHTAELFRLFEKFDIEAAAIFTFPPGFKLRQHSRTRFLDSVITSTSTVLNSLEIARRHGVEHRTTQLGWLATTSQPFFDKYFGEATLAGLQSSCPFAPEEQREKTGVIWQVPSLAQGPWPSRRFCPESVPLWHGGKGCYTTAATERLQSVMPIARQLLWRSDTEAKHAARP